MLTVEYLKDGLSTHDPVAELKLVHQDELPLEGSSVDDESDEDEDEEDDEAMDIDEKPTIDRATSPDFSWLPPLPGTAPKSTSAELAQPGRRLSTVETPQSAPASIVDRYRIRIPFASSSLASRSTPYTDPPRAPERPYAPATSSLPSLIQTYAATRSEPSLTLRQTDTRRQAFELLRRQIAPPDKYSPSASLSYPNIPAPPRISPIVPSYSSDETLHPPLLPINPDPSSSLLSQLVHSIQTPHLPPDLRERLTSLRPPLPQKKDNGEPILYGPPTRGPDTAALLRAKGKPWNPEDEAFLYATWDSGPKGIKKWGRGELPTGKKVIRHVKGDEAPRRPEGYKPPVEVKRTVKLSLGRGNTSLSPNPATTSAIVTDDSPAPAQATVVSPSTTPASMTLTLPTLPSSSASGPTLTIPVPDNRATLPTISPASTLSVPLPDNRAALSPIATPSPGPATPGGGPTLKLKLGVRSLTPNTGPASPAPSSGNILPGVMANSIAQPSASGSISATSIGPAVPSAELGPASANGHQPHGFETSIFSGNHTFDADAARTNLEGSSAASPAYIAPVSTSEQALTFRDDSTMDQD